MVTCRKCLSFLLLFIVTNGCIYGQKANTLPRPKLVVGIMVDQMRWDYLYRYYDRYQENGFKRMLREGFTCENTFIDYVPTVTAVGHSTVYTGTVPAIHGIAGNDFVINATGKNMYCTEDSTAQTVGSSSTAGRMSPKNLLTTTITDQLKLATNFRSKVIGIALKDRGAILPAGHTANAAYWFDNLIGGWITSDFYMNQLPEWVKKFNGSKLAEKYLKQDWNTLYDIKTYVQSTADDTKYEGRFSGQPAPVFPVKTSGMFTADNYDVIRTTPYGNTITADFAKAAVENEKLGMNGVTDFLAVSFSSPDYIGHRFGVNAIEVEDTYLRLDRDLASLFTYLDARLGKGNYTAFLTADHGAANNADFMKDNRMPAGLWSSGALQRDLNTHLEGTYKVKSLVNSMSNYQVHFNQQLLASNKLDEAAIIRDCLKFLRTQPAIAFAADINNLEEAALPQLLKERIINGYNRERSGPITIVLKPGWYSGSATGTTHGSWNSYDAHIPLVWMGWGIKQGKSSKRVNMSDIAPTLAALLHIEAPNGCTGNSIDELIK
jgi:predicted AlkP superfamily pyrophosphatase or phosphodiesterase